MLSLLMKAGVVMNEVSSKISVSESESKVVDLGSFKRKKEIAAELGQGRTPLYVSHLDGKLKGSPHLKSPGETSGTETSDFGDRLQRIRMSLEKINSLMFELKKMSSAKAEQISGSSTK